MVRVRRFIPLLITFIIFLGVEFFYSPNVDIFQKSPTISEEALPKVKVTRVIDGDTIEIESGEKVRFIGIDTPEISGRTDCYGNESKEYLKNFLDGKEIKLEKDVSEKDKYGRLLRFVYLEDVLVNKKIVEDGYARVSTFPPDVKFQDMFLEAQESARNGRLGLWSQCF
jgi:micrococcal nuclease